MRVTDAIALLLTACLHNTVAPTEPEEHHPCDPRGADVARYAEPEELETALFTDERTLRGECRTEPVDARFDTVSETVTALTREVGSETCTGACEPMRGALPVLDTTHDLEDNTLQRECTAATAKLGAELRAGCRHVCIVDRRRLASKAIFARVMSGLFAFASRLPAANADDEAVRRTWHDAGRPLPPKRFHLSADPTTMSADGTFYPGGPALKLRLMLGDAGCGRTSWTVLPW